MNDQSKTIDIRDYLKNLRPRVVDGLETYEEEGGVLLYNPASTHAVALNPTAQVVLELCDGTRSTFEIARLLSDETGEDTATILTAVVDTLLKLRQQSIVDIEGLVRTEEEKPAAAGFQEDRLDFRLPEFTRISWVDDNAESVWSDRIRRIQHAWQEIEWRSIATGVRRCALISVSEEGLVDLAGRLLEDDLVGLPIAVHDASRGYSTSATAPKQGQPVRLRIAIGTPTDVLQLKAAVQDYDDEAIGEMLGYPSCCRRFFQQHWVQKGMIDTTWPMATNSMVLEQDDIDKRLIDISGKDPYQANILWRWMGVRAVPHLPCSFRCVETVAFAEKLIAIGCEEGFVQEMDWLEDILSWPVEWSALHGIAEIKAPVLKVSTRTDATAHKYIVRKRGTRYPAEGASGVNFPYRGGSDSRPAGLADRDGADESEAARVLDWYASDNGFDSVEAMESAHEPIVSEAVRMLSTRGASVLDLGCGNGALLRSICRRGSGIVPYGIESNAERAAHARVLLQEFDGSILTGDMFENVDMLFDDDTRYTLALLMAGRLLEVESSRSLGLRERLARHTGAVLLYAYDDWLTRFEGMSGLLAECDIESPGSIDGPVVIVDSGSLAL